MRTNKLAIDLIKSFEGLRLEAYKCSAGHWTIGYGFAETNGLSPKPHAGMKINQAEADALLQKNLTIFEQHVSKAVQVPINENEFGAFVSLCFNIGPGAFAKSSALRHFNQGNKAKAADSILLFNKAGGKVLNGLVRRRQAERALFLAPVSHKTERKPQIGVGALVAAIMAGLGLWLADLFEPIRNLFGG